MTVGRGVVLLMVFVVLGVCSVRLRTQETHLAARIQELRGERRALRREAWGLQVEIARLRTPDQIRDRVERWRLAVRDPAHNDVALVGGEAPPR